MVYTEAMEVWAVTDNVRRPKGYVYENVFGVVKVEFGDDCSLMLNSFSASIFQTYRPEIAHELAERIKVIAEAMEDELGVVRAAARKAAKQAAS